MKVLENGVERDATPAEIEYFNSRPTTPPVPRSVTPLQARRALRGAGLLDAVNAAIAASPEEVQETWEYAIAVQRDNAIIAQMAADFGLTSEQVDDLFRTAATL